MADGCSSIREELKPILKLVESKAHSADQLRQPDLEVIKKLAESDLLKLLVPRDYGGREEPLSVLVEFSETLAFSHGSTGLGSNDLQRGSWYRCSILTSGEP